jgi:hypothetical protein
VACNRVAPKRQSHIGPRGRPDRGWCPSQGTAFPEKGLQEGGWRPALRQGPPRAVGLEGRLPPQSREPLRLVPEHATQKYQPATYHCGGRQTESSLDLLSAPTNMSRCCRLCWLAAFHVNIRQGNALTHLPSRPAHRRSSCWAASPRSASGPTKVPGLDEGFCPALAAEGAVLGCSAPSAATGEWRPAGRGRSCDHPPSSSQKGVSGARACLSGWGRRWGPGPAKRPSARRRSAGLCAWPRSLPRPSCRRRSLWPPALSRRWLRSACAALAGLAPFVPGSASGRRPAGGSSRCTPAPSPSR